MPFFSQKASYILKPSNGLARHILVAQANWFILSVHSRAELGLLYQFSALNLILLTISIPVFLQSLELGLYIMLSNPLVLIKKPSSLLDIVCPNKNENHEFYWIARLLRLSKTRKLCISSRLLFCLTHILISLTDMYLYKSRVYYKNIPCITRGCQAFTLQLMLLFLHKITAVLHKTFLFLDY